MNEQYKLVTKDDYTFMQWARTQFQFDVDQQDYIVGLYRKLINPQISRCSGCKGSSQILDFKRELDVFLSLNSVFIEKNLGDKIEVETITTDQIKTITPKKRKKG